MYQLRYFFEHASRRRSPKELVLLGHHPQTATTPTLNAAARANDVVLLDALLQDQVDIDERDARGYSALMLATYSGSWEAFDLLLARGADPNGRDFGGNTILMAAAFKGHVPMIRRLLACGADVSATNAAGLTALGFAEQFGRHEVRPLLSPPARPDAG